MNLGAGRIVYQDLTRIDAAIEDGSFFDNAELRGACDAAKAHGGTLHVMGLLSPGGVHSHETHIFAMLELAQRAGVPRVAVHAFLDGRDTPPRSAAASLRRAAGDMRRARQRAHRHASAAATTRWIATSAGIALRRAWDAIVEAQSEHRAPTRTAALDAAYARGENDEFVAPTVIDGAQRRCADGDAVVFMNFRADRARQLTAAFVDPGVRGLRRRARPRAVALRLPDRIRREAAGAGRVRAGRPAPHARRTGRRTRPDPAAHRRDREIRARHLLLQRRPRGRRSPARNASWCRARRSRPTTCSRR